MLRVCFYRKEKPESRQPVLVAVVAVGASAASGGDGDW